MAYDDMPKPMGQAHAAPRELKAARALRTSCKLPFESSCRPLLNVRAGFARSLALALGALACAFPGIARAQSGTLQPVTITSVSVNSDSVKVDFLPVPGAQDYRIYALDDPSEVKYAGVWHLDADGADWPWSNLQFNVDANGNPIYPLTVIPNPNGQPAGSVAGWSQYHHIDIPATEIEYNGLPPGQPVKLVVEAVDAQGPAAYMCLYDSNNDRIFPLDADCDPAIGECALGSNMGCTWYADQVDQDVMTTNGQGDYHNDPNVIARSQPFVVTATGAPTLPDSPAASQVFCDTFESGTFSQPTNQNIIEGSESYTLTTPAGVWDVQTDDADIRDSSTFIDNDHLMDVLFDGSTPGSNDPLHVAHGALAFSPEQTADISGGKILHVTMEVDSHTDGRRWVAFNLAPASDPLQHWYGSSVLNNTDTAFFEQFQANDALADEYIGPNSDGTPHIVAIAGPAGAAMYGGYRQMVNWQYGHGLDNRSRFDLFISTTHFAVYEDGRELYEYDLPTPLPFSQVKVYYTAYLYHSGLEQCELSELRPYETYWMNVMPYSDERHWDNMGFEVLPANTPWSGLGSLISMPQPVPPVYTTSTLGGSNPVAPPPVVPSTPQNLGSAGSDKQVALSWLSSNNASGYDVYRGTASGAESLYQTGVLSTSWVDTHVSNGVNYYYYVTAVNSAGQSGASNETSATPHTGIPPQPPTNLRVVNTHRVVNLYWQGPGQKCTYNVYRGTSPGGESSTPIATGLTTWSFTDHSANPRGVYYYTVSATNINGTSGMSNEGCSAFGW